MSMVLVPFRATQGANRPGPAGIRNQMGCPTAGFHLRLLHGEWTGWL